MGLFMTSDDDGSKSVDDFLDDYTRTTVKAACKDEIPLSQITVWVNDEARWRKLSTNEISELTKFSDRSLCRAISTNLFKLDEKQYQSMKHTLEQKTSGLEGIYEKISKSGKMYALIVRLPVNLAEQRRTIAKYVSLPTLAVTSAGTLGYQVYDRRQPYSSAWRESQRDYKIYSTTYWPRFMSNHYKPRNDKLNGEDKLLLEVFNLIVKNKELFTQHASFGQNFHNFSVSIWKQIKHDMLFGEFDFKDIMDAFYLKYPQDKGRVSYENWRAHKTTLKSLLPNHLTAMELDELKNMISDAYKTKNVQGPGKDGNGEVVYPISFKNNIESLIQTFTDREVYPLEKLIPDINELNADVIAFTKNLVKTTYENKNAGKSPDKDEGGNNLYSIKNRIWIKKEITDQIIANNSKRLNL
jgi:hypothetical protein